MYGYAAPTTVDVTDITLNKSSTTLTVGDKETLTATVAPDDATDKTVKWSVNNTNVKLYSDSACTTEVGTDAVSVMTVYAKGKSAGNATVTVTSNADNTKTASCDVTVNAAAATITNATVNLSSDNTVSSLTIGNDTITDLSGFDITYGTDDSHTATEPPTEAGIYYAYVTAKDTNTAYTGTAKSVAFEVVSVDTITIGDNANGYDTIDNSAHTFEAYQIFSADLSKVDDKTVLTNLDWGANVTIKNNDTNATAFLADLKSAGTALNTNKFSTLTYESGKSQKFANDIALILQSETNDTPEAKAFAQAVSKYLTGTALPSSDNKITISDAGYYLVQDASGSPTDNTAKTRYILCVADTVTVQTKVSLPKVVKKVKENTDVSDYE